MYLSASISKIIDHEAQYIKNRAFDDQYYKDLIINYLKEYQNAKKKDLRVLLWNKLPDILNDNQKERKIGNLLASLRKNGDIKTDPKDRTSWILKK